MSIGNRVRELRQSKDMTQEQLARLADLGLSHIARLEQGKIGDPSWSTVRAIAKALGVALTELEDDDEKKAKPVHRGPRPK